MQYIQYAREMYLIQNLNESLDLCVFAGHKKLLTGSQVLDQLSHSKTQMERRGREGGRSYSIQILADVVLSCT